MSFPHSTRRVLPKWCPTLATLGLLLALPAWSAEYTVHLSPDAELGLWSVWQTGVNEYQLEARIAHATSDPAELQLWNLELNWNPALLEAVGAPVEGDVFDGLGNSHFNHYGGAGNLTCTGVLLGLEETLQPVDGALLFSQTFHALDPAGGPAAIAFGTTTLRDGSNQDIDHLQGPAVQLMVDVTPPQGYAMSLQAYAPAGNTSWTSQQLVEVLSVIGDGTLAALQLNETPPLIPNTDPGWTAPPIPGAVILSAGDGPKMVHLHLRDLYGNRLSLQDDIILDTTAPAYHVTEFQARPRHEGCLLTWRNPTAPDFDHVRIYRGHWLDGSTSSYPEYDDIAPMDAYPATWGGALAAGFQLVYSGTAESWTDPVVPRDVYRYVAFTVDHAHNVGLGHPDARDRSANYILGDTWVPFDGRVFALDLLRLANSYYTLEGHPLYQPAQDFGPTDDTSREGIPLTDNRIGFEDLMIFAMNYGTYGPPSPADADSLAGLSGLRVEERDGERRILLERAPQATDE